MIEKLGLEGIGSNEKVKGEEKEEEILEECEERASSEEAEDEEWLDLEEDSDHEDWLSFYGAPQLNGASWKSGSAWRRMRAYFSDLADYETKQESVTQEEFWRKMKKWELLGKVIQKKGSYFRLNRFSWDEAR